MKTLCKDLKMVHRWIALLIFFGVILITIAAAPCSAALLPFLDATLDPVPTGHVDNTTILTSYTTSAGTVTNLATAISATGTFDKGGDSGFRNTWGVAGTEIDGVEALLNLDISTGTLGAGDSNDTSTIILGGVTGDAALRANFFFSRMITAGVPGDGNDFFFVENGGNDAVMVYPLDADSNAIGDFSLSILASDWGNSFMTAGYDRVGDSVAPLADGVTRPPFGGLAFDFEDFTGTGTLHGLWGIGFTSTDGMDTLVVGVNSQLVPEPTSFVTLIAGLSMLVAWRRYS